MKNSLISAIVVSFVATALIEATPEFDYSKLKSPPMDATAGELKDNVQIGLWTEMSKYQVDEIRNVWIFARKNGKSKFSIGVGGNLFTDSFLYIYHDGKQLKKIPEAGGADGMVDGTSFMGGISDILKDLPKGAYQLIWKTSEFESNTIDISIQ